jgi:FkbM family methyltransferase
MPFGSRGVAWVTPAAGLGDFHRQTSRSIATRRAAQLANPTAQSGAPDHRAVARIAIRAGLDDPGGLVAYSFARAISALRTALGAQDSLRTWQVARSTKGGSHPEASEHARVRELAAKAQLGVRTASFVRNWPSVLVTYGWNRGRAPAKQAAEMEFHFRDGTRIVCLRGQTSAYPVFEVLIDDAYRIGVLRRLLPDGPIAVVDVGAHVGSASVAFARGLSVRSVVCAEPSPTSAALLRRNLAANAIPSTVVEAAVGAAAGSVQLIGALAGSWAAAVSRAEEPSDPSIDMLRVPMVAMSDLLARAGNGPVVVKMDCEGSEYEIVAGTPAAAWDTVCAIVLEYHPVAETGGWSWLVERLAALGFRLVWHAPIAQPLGQGTACFVRARPRGQSAGGQCGGREPVDDGQAGGT